MFKRVIAFIIAAFSALSGLITDYTQKYTFEIDSSEMENIIGNKVSNINIWMPDDSFYVNNANDKDNVFDFVEYVQVMQCTGGNAERDLFENPYDNTVLTDYKFDKLIDNCRDIIALGAKPCLKFGNVPMKYSKGFYTNGMEVNVLPPDDYDVYYDYIKAIGNALVNEFGKEEVQTWHFTCFTEYENADWFECDSADKSMKETCRMYDYIVDALQNSIGENIYIGAHSMTVTEGLWDEADFIKHCAVGTNYKTGKKGTRLCFLSASYYESEPGFVGKRKSLSGTIRYLRKNAEKYGLELDYGIDEGRILSASSGRDDSQLLSRTVGYTYQAAFDAIIYGTMIDEDIDCFSMWSYKSEGINTGIPTVSFHVAKLISTFAGAFRVKVRKAHGGLFNSADVRAYAAFDNNSNSLKVMCCNYKNDINYKRDAEIILNAKIPQFKDGPVKITQYIIGDDCNFFDDWMKDRADNGIGNESFGWSPDCPRVGNTIIDEKARKLYEDNKEKYYTASVLSPTETTAEIKGGMIEMNVNLKGNNVAFFEISQ